MKKKTNERHCPTQVSLLLMLNKKYIINKGICSSGSLYTNPQSAHTLYYSFSICFLDLLLYWENEIVADADKNETVGI